MFDKLLKDLERDLFRQAMSKLTTEHNIGAISKLTPEMTCLCTRAANFKPEDNDMWELEDNKSLPRDVRCNECNELLAMSNWMYAQYTAMPQKPRVLCAQCMMVKLPQIEKKAQDESAG